jgi:hypothetical protein
MPRPQALELRAGGFERARLAHDLFTLVDLREQLIAIGAAKIRVDFDGIRRV